MMVLGVMLSWALLGGAARAQEEGTAADIDARARELYDNGAILYDEGRYEDAIVAWEEAYRLSGRPLLLYNIANAQERLGQWRAALDTLNRYRAYARPEERERLDRRIANLERRLAEDPGLTAAPPASPPPPTAAPEDPRQRRWRGSGGGSIVFGCGT